MTNPLNESSSVESPVGGRSSSDMDRRRAINKVILSVFGAIALLIAAMSCSGGSADTANPGSPEASGATDSPEVVVRITDVTPPDVAAYLKGTALRLPEGVSVPDRRMVEYGKLGCGYTQGYVTGSSPTPGDRLMKDIMSDGFDSATADDIADAARNAGSNTLCVHEFVEARTGAPRA